MIHPNAQPTVVPLLKSWGVGMGFRGQLWLFKAMTGLLVWVTGVAGAEQGGLLFRRYTQREGLPAAPVNTVLQDSRGFMWFATYDGLVRFDGVEFRTCRPDARDTNSITSDAVMDVVEDPGGDLWIATQDGLNLWHRDTGRFSHFRHRTNDTTSLSHNSTTVLAFDAQGFLWVGTDGGGVNRFDPKTRQCERFAPWEPGRAISDNHVRALYLDHAGRMWIGTHEGLDEFDPTTRAIRTFKHDPDNTNSLSHPMIRSIAEDQSGRLWVGTGNGVSRLDRERRRFDRLLSVPKITTASVLQEVGGVLVDRSNQVWVAIDGGGLSKYVSDAEGFVHHRHIKYVDQTIASDVVRKIYEDRNGDLWLGHWPGGVSYANRLHSALGVYRTIPGQTNTLADDNVFGFLEDPDGTLWVATDGAGVNRLNPTNGVWSVFRHDPTISGSLSAKAALTLARDHLGQLWVGTWNGGLNRYDPTTGTFTSFQPVMGNPNSLVVPHIWSIVETPDGHLWLGTTGGGVDELIPAENRFVHHRNDPLTPDSLNDDVVNDLLLTRDGTLWAGTLSGLARWNPATRNWERYTKGGGGLSRSLIRDLFEDRHGKIWIATDGEGLKRLDPHTEHLQTFSKAEGFPCDLVRGILEDDDGVLWVSTNDGIVRFNPETPEMRVYDESNGLPGRQFNGASCLRLRSGKLLFGCTQGFVSIDPKLVRANTNPPPVVLTTLEIFNREIRPLEPQSPLTRSLTETRELRLPAKDSMISLRFAALNFRSQERNRYLYRLEGFDEDWHEPGPERRATYTNLDPGRYRFHVKASNNAGVWNETGASLDIVIVPPWWQTVWFRAGSVLGLAMGLILMGWVVAGRRSHKRVEEAERDRALAEERRHAAEALAESQALYRSLVDNIPQCILRKDAAGRLTFVNENFCRLLGRPVAEMLGRTNVDLYPADLARKYQQDDEEVMRTGRPLERVEENQTAGGGIISVQVVKTPIRDAIGKIAGLQCIFWDITDRKRDEENRLNLERQMLQVQKLESLGVLAGGIAHDFNNLLTAILGNADLALHDLPPMSPARETIREIEATSRRAADLCRQMLAYSGRGQFVIETIDLRELIEEMVHLLRTSISKKALLNLNLEKNLPPVRGDATQFRQIIMNLVINASEAIGERSGVITISTGASECSSEYLREAFINENVVGGLFVWLEVSDTGCGMDAATRQRIFEPFFTTKFTGRGLGLSAVMGIVRGHKGAMNVYSELGKGTTFKILLPAVEETAAVRIPTASAAPFKGSGVVLLVDDEETVRAVGRRMLEKCGFEVWTARDGREAVDVYRERGAGICLVMLDLTMPRLNGEEAFRELRNLNPKVRVILTSGYSEGELTARFAGKGMAGFLQKPFTIREIEARLGTLLSDDATSQPERP